MPDRDASFFGPVLPQPADAEEAFTAAERQLILGRRLEAAARLNDSAWPEHRRFVSIYPHASATVAPALRPPTTIIVRGAGPERTLIVPATAPRSS